MKRFCLLSKLAVLTALLASVASIGVSQDIPPLGMMAIPSRSVYWVGEPVVIRGRIYNWLSPLMTLSTSFGLQGQTTLRIVQDGREGPSYRAHFDQAPVASKPYILPYGKMLQFRVLAEYDTNTTSHLIFDTAGTYTLSFEQNMSYRNEYNVGEGEVPYSQKLRMTIRVVDPPAEGAKALDLLESNPDAIRDLNRLMASPSSEDILKRVAKEFPDTPYAPFCLHALGSYSSQMTDVLLGENEIAGWAYKELIDKYPDYPLRDEVRSYLASFYYKTSRGNDAYEIAEQMMRESEDNLYIFRDHPIIGQYHGKKGNQYSLLNTEHWELFGNTQMPNAYEQIRLEELR